jgi:hypothetical protein
MHAWHGVRVAAGSHVDKSAAWRCFTHSLEGATGHKRKSTGNRPKPPIACRVPGSDLTRRQACLSISAFFNVLKCAPRSRQGA